VVKYNWFSIATIIIGLYLIFEGIGSFVIFDDQNDLFQAGRIFRVLAGFFLVFVVSRMIK
jgi:hypothetical protein